MGGFIDLTGQRFGRLLVLKRDINKTHDNHAKWLCICDCGNTTIANGTELRRRSLVKSCGCYAKEINKNRLTKHGKSNIRLHVIWNKMRGRCNSKNVTGYQNYGARGIIVTKEWDNFIDFYDWALKNGYKENLTIDRIDNDGNYEPSNCRWITMKEQMSNKRSNHYVSFNGYTKTLSQWAEEFGISRSALRARICNLNWPIEKALTTPIKNNLGEALERGVPDEL